MTTTAQNDVTKLNGAISSQHEHESIHVETIENAQPEALLTLESTMLHELIKETEGLKEMVPAISIKMNYKTFEREGDKCRGIFAKFESIPNSRGERLDSVVWMGDDKCMYYHSGIILVELCRKFNIRPGIALEIEYKGKKKGRTMDFNVTILKIK